MQDVETIGFELDKPGFAYPALNGWDLGLDNVRISQNIPESGPGVMFPSTAVVANLAATDCTIVRRVAVLRVKILM